jgi:predicted phosphodiesterase
MRIAILADIHGNLPAFEAALEHVARQHVDRLIIAGDIVVGAPDSAACWRLAQTLGCPILRGNHERYVAHYRAPGAPAEWATDRFAPLRWGFEQLEDAERHAIERLPLALRPLDLPELLVVHASLRADRDSIVPYTPAEQLAAMFPEVRERWIVRGHNHAGMVRPWNGRTIITAGAVGLPLDGNPTAQYLLLEQHGGDWQIQHQSVPYDVDATLRRFHESGYLDAAGPMARLYMREVATAAHHVVPFLRAYERWSAQALVPLAAAVERFLAWCD